MRSQSKKESGFSLIEIMLATGMTGFLVMGATTVMNGTVASQKKTEIQSIADREFALGSQIAANADVIKRVIGLNTNDECLTKDKNAALRNCASTHQTADWTPFPDHNLENAPNPENRLPRFNGNFSLNGSSCNVSDPRNGCHLRREMFFRWICTPNECSGVETKVVVRSLNNQAASGQYRNQSMNFRDREVVIRLDRRQLTTRAEIAFSCRADESIVGLTYDQAADVCQQLTQTNCSQRPQRTYDPFASDLNTNCAPPLASDCGADGYEYTGIYSGSARCRAPAPGRTTGTIVDQDGGTVPNTFTQTGVTVGNASTSYQTFTHTETTTTTVTVVGEPPAPACNMATHQLIEYEHPTWGFYYPLGPDPTAVGLGYHVTGETLTVFNEDCGTRDRTALVDCFVQVGFNGYHYLGNEECGPPYGGSGGTVFGYAERNVSAANGYGRSIIRYANGVKHKSTYGSAPAGYTFEGGQGHTP